MENKLKSVRRVQSVVSKALAGRARRVLRTDDRLYSHGATGVHTGAALEALIGKAMVPVLSKGQGQC